MMRLEEWPSSTEFGLQARLHDEALISRTGGEGLQCFSESARVASQQVSEETAHEGVRVGCRKMSMKTVARCSCKRLQC